MAAAFAAPGLLSALLLFKGLSSLSKDKPAGQEAGQLLDQPSGQPKNQKKKRLMVLTYSSFAGVYGPGRKLKSRFESFCGCKIQWLVSEDSTALIQRLFVYPSVDLIVGLDQISARAAARLKWQPLDGLYALIREPDRQIPVSPEGQASSSSERHIHSLAAPAGHSSGGFSEEPAAAGQPQAPEQALVKEALFEGLPLDSRPFFLPIDWAPVGFLYKESSAGRGKNSAKSSRFARAPTDGSQPPKAGHQTFKPQAKRGLRASEIISLRQLPELQGQISFPDPRTSVLGMQLYYWIYQAFGGDLRGIKAFLARLRPRIYGPVFSWSRSYGFFQKGRVDMSLSYLTSLAYHIEEEAGGAYRFARFREGHPVHVEFAALPAGCASCGLARGFAGFLLSREAQKIIMESHYMLPARGGMQKSAAFAGLGSAKAISYKNLDQFMSQKKRLLSLWERAMR